VATWRKWLGWLVLAAAVILAPTAGGATEFSLGGFIALFAVWDSTQMNSNGTQAVWRNNDPNNHHGRLKISAERLRMNFTVKGPEVWGAMTSAFIEWDFCGSGQEYIFTGNPGGGWASPHKARPRLRHAMFRLNWPETELLLGQYWCLLSEDGPEAAKPGTSGIPGIIWYREPQIRLTQQFLGRFEAAVAVAEPGSGADSIKLPGDQTTTTVQNYYLGESAESPRVVARIKYEEDLWGKAAYYGRPRGFAVRVAGAWQRLRFRAYSGDGRQFGEDNFNPVTVRQRDQQYLNAWVAQTSFFIPVLTTRTENLAGTLSLLTHWYVGTALDLEKEADPANSSYLNLVRREGSTYIGDRQLARQFGGFVQAQYYFTNQWYVNLLWGMNRVFDLDRDRWLGSTTSADPVKRHQHCYVTLWYNPIKALKFGLEYGYYRTDYFQKTGATGTSAVSDHGENHRLVAVGYFFF